MKPKIIRQGDVTLRPIEKPKGEWTKQETVTLALGEATGHHHTLYPNTPGMLFEVLRQSDKFFVHVPAESLLEHQEHKCFERVPATTYEIIIKENFDYEKGEMERVTD